MSETLQADTYTWTVGYGYTGNGHLATLTYPDSLSVDYAPNALGQPTQAGTWATNVTYYPNGAIAGFTYGNGIVHTMTQNARGLPERSRDANGSTAIHDDSVDYDANGNVLAISDGVAGNLANKNGVAYTFDYGNRLRAGGPETYRYDAHGRRVRSSSSAGLAYSLYSQSGQILFQRDERSSKRRQYIYLGGSLVAERSRPIGSSTATVTYQHTDALGTPVAITNGAKTVLERREYEPYGFLTNGPTQDGPGYTGHITDAATGLVYMQQRYYDPKSSRLLSDSRDRPSTWALLGSNGAKIGVGRVAESSHGQFESANPRPRRPAWAGCDMG